MTKIAGKCEIKYLIAGVGWATAELITTRYADCFEFKIKFLQNLDKFIL
jgi:hypothetical protein